MTFKDVLDSHIARYPLMQIQDVYKLAYQAALGSEHAVTDPEAVRRWLERELADLGPGPVEPLSETISPDGQLVRVHLRPYVQLGYQAEVLANAFLATAQEYSGQVSSLEEYWRISVSQDHFPAVDMENFIQQMKVSQYPAVHHSSAYRQAYHPAYRVVLRKYVDGL